MESLIHQHHHQDHPPLQILKEHSHPIPSLHPVLFKPHQPHLHQGIGKDRHQPHHHKRHQPPPRYWTLIYDTDRVEKTRRYSLGILLLTGRPTEREIKTQYRILVRISHPEKHDSYSTGMTLNQVEEHLKNINNAYEYLRSQLWNFPHFLRK